MASLADKKKALDWSNRNARGFQGILDVNQFLPVTGDIQSGIMAGQDLQKGNYGAAALNSLGLLPFIPALGGTVAKQAPEFLYHGTTPEAAKAIEKSGFDLAKSADGTIWFTSNPKIGEVGATGQGGIVKRKLNNKLREEEKKQ